MPAPSPSPTPNPHIVRLVVTADGRAWADGTPVAVPAGVDPRTAARSVLSQHAIRTGQPVRATLADPSGRKSLLAYVDGSVYEADSPDLIDHEPDQPEEHESIRSPAQDERDSSAEFDPDSVPRHPELAIKLNSDGIVTVNKVPVRAAADAPRAAAIEAAARIAERLGRPVRATATDEDGTQWPLVIHPDGSVTPIGEPVVERHAGHRLAPWRNKAPMTSGSPQARSCDPPTDHP